MLLILALGAWEYTPTPSFPTPLSAVEEGRRGCIPTFQPDSKTKVVVFLAPIFRGDSEEDRRQKWSIGTWKEATEQAGNVRLAFLASEHLVIEYARSHGIPYLCVSRTLFGPPRFDEIVYRVHNSIERGVVVFANSDIGVLSDGVHPESVQRLSPESADTLARGPRGHTSLLNLLSLSTLLGNHQKPVHAEWGPFETLDAAAPHSSWLAVGRRFDISASGKTSINTDGGYDVWAWNVFPGCEPLLPFAIPPFRIARPNFDNWFLSLSISIGQRHVIDITDSFMTLHHAHHHRFRGGDVASKAAGGYDNFYKSGDADNYINYHLAFANYTDRRSGRNFSYAWTHGTACEAPFVTATDGAKWALRRRWVRSGFKCAWCFLSAFKMNCPADGVGDHNSTWGRQVARLTAEQTEKERRQSMLLPGLKADMSRVPVELQRFYKAANESWPFRFREILELRASRPGKIVMLFVASSSARDFVANFHCSMTRLGVDNHVLAAIDDELYRWAVLQSIPVFPSSALGLSKVSPNYATYDTEAFNLVTKMKIALALEVLKAGYSVVVSDTDVAWVRNPIPLFTALSAQPSGSDATMFVSSNSPMLLPDRGKRNLTLYGPTGRPRYYQVDHIDNLVEGKDRINSGVYFAPAREDTVRAFKAIHREALAHPKLNDQPSFTEVLCHNPGIRLADDACLWKWGPWRLRVKVLPRLQFVSGAVFVSERDRLIDVVTREDARSLQPPIFALHYNWIEGSVIKRSLMQRSSFWLVEPHSHASYCRLEPRSSRSRSWRKASGSGASVGGIAGKRAAIGRQMHIFAG